MCRDYAEISLTRRVYRGDGSNDYFINKVPVRLRDVTEVFLGTGVGRQAYSIVEQGKIGLIVSARPEERRVLIEEAAGITKYKSRRRQAENKMKLTRQNLARVSDLVGEIERQISSLKRQAAKASRYVRYREELDDLLLWDASHKLLELIVCTSVASKTCNELDARVSEARTNVAVRDAEIEVMRNTTHNAESAAEKAQNEAFTSDNDVREYDAQIERSSDRFEHLSEQLNRAREDQHQLEAKGRELEHERDSLQSVLNTIERERSNEQGLVAGEIAKLDQLGSQNDDAEKTLAAARQQEATVSAKIAATEAQIAGIDQRRTEAVARHEHLSTELEKLKTDELQLSNSIEQLATRAEDLVNRKHALCDARDVLQRELPELQGKLAAHGQTLDGQRSALHDSRSRLHALEEIAERMEGVGAGVRNLLKTGDPALAGILADRVEVPVELTASFAAVAGDRLECVIVDDSERALELLRALANDEQGRATIIPRTLPRSSNPLPAFAGDGVLGPIIDRIGYQAEDEAVLRALVGSALLARSAADAQLLISRGVSHDVVTLDGTMFHSDGRITGGAGDGLAMRLLEQKREMASLNVRIEEDGLAVRTAQSELEHLKQRLNMLREALDEANSEAHAAEIEMVNGKQELRQMEQRIELLVRRRQDVEREVAEATQRSETASRELNAAKLALTATQTDSEELFVRLDIAAKHAVDARALFSEQQAACTERKIQLAAVQERFAASQSALERIDRSGTELDDRIQALESERDQAASEAGTTAAGIVLARAALQDAKQLSREAHAEFEAARHKLDDVRQHLALREAELRELRRNLDEANEQLQAGEMDLQRLQLERTHLDTGIRDRFRGLRLASVVGDYHTRAPIGDPERDRSKELTGLIDRMGSVNLDAMAEYEEASSRYTHFTRQLNDLEKALADLEKAITQMNRESKRLFKHAFEGINRRFKEIFPKMFRGGQAELKLTDPSDLLETGIDIFAQPPGKRLGNLELMSGGEKAFTAVSLLLAIFRFKPSPFCILDEVDAPLDDANIDRYVEGIRAMTDRSQFILITHSKRTMQACDLLYGVTMQEPGVSKLVGVRVAEHESRSERRSSPPTRSSADSPLDEDANPLETGAQDEDLSSAVA